jgi:hypothetical protein
MRVVLRVALAYAGAAAICIGLPGCGADTSAPAQHTSGVHAITVSCDCPTRLLVGEEVNFQATAFNSAGVRVPAVQPPVWTSTNETVARVSNTGVVTTVGAGTASIRASVDGKTGGADITVSVPAAMLAVSASKTDVCGITADARLYCAGKQHGTIPQQVAPTIRFRTIKGFGSRLEDNSGFCALAADHTAYCWGSNSWGQLGVGDTMPRASPTPVAGGLQFKSISPGDLVTCAVTLDGTGYCWGAGSSGAIGDGSPLWRRDFPARVSIDEPLKQISAGNQSEGGRNGPNGYGCAITEQGKLYCWGGNTTGQLGDGKVPYGNPLPQPAASDLTFTTLNESNGMFACALTDTGEAFCWGNAVPLRISTFCPFLPVGVHACLAVPTQISTDLRFTTLTKSAIGMCGITTQRQIACWGISVFDPLESSCAEGCSVPVRGPEGYLSVSSSVYTTCGITVNQRAYCWGDNASSQIGEAAGMTVGKPSLFRVPATQ